MPSTIERHLVQSRRLHWLCWHPTPYLEHLFVSLSKSQDIELVVHYLSPLLATHPWKTTFGENYQSRICNLWYGIDWHLLSLGLRDTEAYFLVSAWNHPCAQILLTLLRLLHRSYGIWTDTPNLSRKRHPARAWARGSWLRWVFVGSTHILGTGKPGIQALENMGAPQARLVNFPFYIDLSAYKREKYDRINAMDRPLRFLSIGRLQNVFKGHDLAIRALAIAAGQSAMPFQYYIAGTGNDERRLKFLVEELHLENLVQFLGWMEPRELGSLYLQSDVLIHPSPSHDPFPNAILEAMAAGLVVLGSNVSGSAVDRIEHGINGFLHRAGDVQELSAQLTYLFDHPGCIPEISKRARETAENWPVERGVTTIQGILCRD